MRKTENNGSFSWNVNDLRLRTIDIQVYAPLCEGTVKALKGTDTEDRSLMTLHDYQCFYFSTDEITNTRSLLTYVRRNMLVELVRAEKQNGTEALLMSMYCHKK